MTKYTFLGLCMMAAVLSASSCLQAAKRPMPDDQLKILEKHARELQERLKNMEENLAKARQVVNALNAAGVVAIDDTPEGQRLKDALEEVAKAEEILSEANERLTSVRVVIVREQENREAGGNPTPLWGFLIQLGLALIRKKTGI